MGLPMEENSSEEAETESQQSDVSHEAQMNINFPGIIGEGVAHQNHIQNNTNEHHRRYSLPPGLLDHDNVQVFCGQILRFMGDEHLSKACGRHLRNMGDEICVFHSARRFLTQHLNTEQMTLTHGEHLTSNAHSLPDLRQHAKDEDSSANEVVRKP